MYTFNTPRRKRPGLSYYSIYKANYNITCVERTFNFTKIIHYFFNCIIYIYILLNPIKQRYHLIQLNRDITLYKTLHINTKKVKHLTKTLSVTHSLQ